MAWSQSPTLKLKYSYWVRTTHWLVRGANSRSADLIRENFRMIILHTDDNFLFPIILHLCRGVYTPYYHCAGLGSLYSILLMCRVGEFILHIINVQGWGVYTPYYYCAVLGSLYSILLLCRVGEFILHIITVQGWGVYTPYYNCVGLGSLLPG